MALLKISFQSFRDPLGYDFRPDPAAEFGIEGKIVPRGTTLEPINPFEFHEHLYLQFAKIPADDAAAFTAFVSRFGPLTHHGNTPDVGENAVRLDEMRMHLCDWLMYAQTDVTRLHRRGFRGMSPSAIVASGEDHDEINESYSRKGEPTVGWFMKEIAEISSTVAMVKANVSFAPPDGRPILTLAPDTLWDGIKLQFYQSICSGAEIKTCKWCGTWFEVGGAGKRSISEFCSNRCRLHAHRHKHGGTK